MDSTESNLLQRMNEAVVNLATTPDAWELNLHRISRRRRRRTGLALSAAVVVVLAATGVVARVQTLDEAVPAVRTSPSSDLGQRCAAVVESRDPTNLAAPVSSYRAVLVARNAQTGADVVGIRAVGSAQAFFCDLGTGVEDAEPMAAHGAEGWLPAALATTFVTGGVVATSSQPATPTADSQRVFEGVGRVTGDVSRVTAVDPTGGLHDATVSGGMWWVSGSYEGAQAPDLVLRAYDSSGRLVYDGTGLSTADDCVLVDGRRLLGDGSAYFGSAKCRSSQPWP